MGTSSSNTGIDSTVTASSTPTYWSDELSHGAECSQLSATDKLTPYVFCWTDCHQRKATTTAALCKSLYGREPVFDTWASEHGYIGYLKEVPNLGRVPHQSCSKTNKWGNQKAGHQMLCAPKVPQASDFGLCKTYYCPELSNDADCLRLQPQNCASYDGRRDTGNMAVCTHPGNSKKVVPMYECTKRQMGNILPYNNYNNFNDNYYFGLGLGNILLSIISMVIIIAFVCCIIGVIVGYFGTLFWKNYKNKNKNKKEVTVEVYEPE